MLLSLLYKLPQTQWLKAQKLRSPHQFLRPEITVGLMDKMELLVGRLSHTREALGVSFWHSLWLLVASKLLACGLYPSHLQEQHLPIALYSVFICLSSVCVWVSNFHLPISYKDTHGCMQGPPDNLSISKILHYICKVFFIWDSIPLGWVGGESCIQPVTHSKPSINIHRGWPCYSVNRDEPEELYAQESA